MHPAAYNYVQEQAKRVTPRKNVVEFGGRNINGSVRPIFEAMGANYTSVDIKPGAGVDVVMDATEYRPQGEEIIDAVICCEVLEHTPKWPAIIAHAGSLLERSDDGVLILTCATVGRAPHSAVDGGPLRDGEYYGNVPVTAVMRELDKAFFDTYDVDCLEKEGDLRLIAWRHDPSRPKGHSGLILPTGEWA